MKAILAIDQGTSASKAAVFDRAGRALAVARVPVRTRFGPGGLAEQDAEELLATQLRAIRRALDAAGDPDIVAAGVASQRSTFVLWDRATGRPVAPAPTWQSTVAADACAARRAHAGAVRRLTGLPLSPHYSASKVARLLEGSRRLRRRAEAGELLFGSVATFLVWHLTGGEVHAIDPTQAARTLLFDLKALDWSDRLLDLFGVPRAVLPHVRHSLDDFGSARVGRREAPLRASLGDQQAAMIGATGLGRGSASGPALVNYGTGAFVLIPTGGLPRRRAGLLTSLAWTSASRRCYLLEGTINAAGATLDWLRRELGAPARLDRIDRLCRQARGEAVMLPASWGMGPCYELPGDPPMPSVVLGLEGASTLPGLVRSAVEAIAHMVADILDRAPAPDGAGPSRLVATGSLAGLGYLQEYQAALLGRPILLAADREATLAGAALAAAGGAGLDQPSARPPRRAVRPPAGLRSLAARRHRRWRRLIQLARSWARADEARA